MDNYKIKVKDEAESKEAQELFEQLGYSNGQSKRFGFVYTQNGEIGCDSMEHWDYYNDLCQELTLPKLRDLVVLKRGDVKDANYKLFISPRQGYLSLYKASNDVFYAYASKSKCWDESRAVDVNTKDLEPIDIEHASEEKDPALISGADAFTYLIGGSNDVQTKLNDTEKWRDVPTGMSWAAFANPDRKFRLKPQTIKVELELPKPFEPEEDCHVYILDDGKTDGYRRYSYEVHGDKGNTFIGIWRTEEEIKQVVEQLRKIRGTNS